jgi:hypothetical protein
MILSPGIDRCGGPPLAGSIPTAALYDMLFEYRLAEVT